MWMQWLTAGAVLVVVVLRLVVYQFDRPSRRIDRAMRNGPHEMPGGQRDDRNED